MTNDPQPSAITDDDLSSAYKEGCEAGVESDDPGNEIDLDYLAEDLYDGLKLCEICGDRETQESICWVCRRQQDIDRHG